MPLPSGFLLFLNALRLLDGERQAEAVARVGFGFSGREILSGSEEGDIYLVGGSNPLAGNVGFLMVS